MTKKKMSTKDNPVKGEGQVFLHLKKLLLRKYNENKVELNAAIKVRVKDLNDSGELETKLIETTVGRVL